jgi:opacity protein-like surface antigen
MPLLHKCFCAAALFTLSLSAVCQDESPAITAVNREIGISFSPSLIAYHEYMPAVLNAEHGWVAGGGFKVAVPFKTLKTHWMADATYEYNDGTSKHTMPNASPMVAAFITNDIFVGVGPTFTPTSRFSVTPEADTEYREWHRGLPFNELDYIEHYTFWAPGVGVRAAYNPIGRFVITTQGGFAYTVFPAMSGSGDAPKEVPPHVFSLDQHNVWQARLGMDYPVSQRIHAFAGIDYSRFGFGASAYTSEGPILKGQHHEPDSVTHLAKVNVGVAWSY